jgi:Spy/CpxP family protein refolding chaperone
MTLLTALTARNVPGWNSASLLGTAALLFCSAIPSFAQTPMAMPQQATAGAGDQNRQLADQVADLRAQVARLQAAQTTGTGGRKVAAPAKMGAGGMGRGMAMGEMAMPMPKDQGEMGSMPAGGGMPIMDDKSEMGTMPSGAGKGNMAAAPAMGMCCMGDKGGMAAGGSAGMGAGATGGGGMAGMNAPASATPGQAGASHIYHIGSAGFFLNHSQHITLTSDQRSTLNRLKEKAMLDKASEERRIDQGEQELYALTGADQPDNGKIQAKIGEIERMRGEQRMSFIMTVGEATKVLSPEQRQALLGSLKGGR